MATFKNRYSSKKDAALAAQIGETSTERLFGTSLGAPKAAKEAWDKVENLKESFEEDERVREEDAAKRVFTKIQKAVNPTKKYSSGGKIRGCGLAVKGHGKGKMY